MDTHMRIDTLFRKTVQKNSRIYNAYLLVHSDKLNVHLNLADGSTGTIAAHANQRYLIASISKLFTSDYSLDLPNRISYLMTIRFIYM